jgi:hypothetical protein
MNTLLGIIICAIPASILAGFYLYIFRDSNNKSFELTLKDLGLKKIKLGVPIT